MTHFVSIYSSEAFTPVQGFAYDQLKEVVKSSVVDRTQKGKSPFPSFDEAMQPWTGAGAG